MNTLETILTRRSIRKYTDKKVSDDMLEIILKSGMYAPSAVNKQPWHFIIFRNKTIAEGLKKVHPNSVMLKQASAGILICYDELLQHDEGFGVVDCSAATQNMLLAAHYLGLGACWIGIHPREVRKKFLQNFLKLPKHVIPFAIISIGYPDEQKHFPERFREDRIHYEKW
ncbi:nitroreductase family protein [Bacteroidota bacterium]